MQDKGFPSGSDGKESACNAGDPGLASGSGRSPGKGNSKAVQYSCLQNPMDRGAWWLRLWGRQESDMIERLNSNNQVICLGSRWPQGSLQRKREMGDSASQDVLWETDCQGPWRRKKTPGAQEHSILWKLEKTWKLLLPWSPQRGPALQAVRHSLDFQALRGWALLSVKKTTRIW